MAEEPKPIDPAVLESFERAFDMGGASCRASCECGREFYDVENQWDWEVGELERLRANPKATAVGHGCGRVCFSGTWYAMDCDCWHAIAGRYAAWLAEYREQIGQFFKLEKKRLEADAARYPDVEAVK